MLNDSQNEILHSWKEISAYIERGVRTLQRYERLMAFPILRPLGKRRSSVMAFRVEVDAWLQRAPQRGFRTRGGEDNTLTAKLAEARQQSRLNRERATTNREQAAQIRQMVRQQREQIRQLNEQLVASLSKRPQAIQR